MSFASRPVTGIPTSWFGAQTLVAKARDKRSKPVANNTRVESRPDGSYALRLHQTDIVTYFADGSIRLDSGGWRTMTTKSRINDALPHRLVLWQDRGEWLISVGRSWDRDNAIPYVDGITFDNDGALVVGTGLSAEQYKAQQDASKALKKAVRGFGLAVAKQVKAWQKAGAIESVGDCFYCAGIVTDAATGSQATSNDHLWAHIREGYVPAMLVLHAFEDKGYRDPKYVMTNYVARESDYYVKRVVEVVRDYLLKVLKPEQPAAPAGHPFEAYVEDAKAALNKPSDFGYFGHDDSLWSTSAPTFSRHRDSQNVENANFEIVWSGLVENFPDLIRPEAREQGYTHDMDRDKHKAEREVENPGGIYVFGCGHWAVGWVDQIVVPVVINHDRPTTADNLHPAFVQVAQAAHALAMYPALPGAEEMAAEFEHADNLRGAQQSLDYATRGEANSPLLAYTAAEYVAALADAEDAEDASDISDLDIWSSSGIEALHLWMTWDEAPVSDVHAAQGTLL